MSNDSALEKNVQNHAYRGTLTFIGIGLGAEVAAVIYAWVTPAYDAQNIVFVGIFVLFFATIAQLFGPTKNMEIRVVLMIVAWICLAIFTLFNSPSLAGG